MDTNTKQAIVVGIDGSANSEAALEWAVAEASRRKLRLIHFCAGIRSLPGGEAVYYDAEMFAASTREALAHAHEHLAVAVSRAAEISPELSVTIEGVADFPAGGLVELSSRADTVVVGRSSHSRPVGAALGSVALQVLTHARCPVVVVHKASGDLDVTAGVVVGVDGSAVSELAVGYAFEQAASRGVPLDVVHAWWVTGLGGLTQDIKSDMVTLSPPAGEAPTGRETVRCAEQDLRPRGLDHARRQHRGRHDHRRTVLDEERRRHPRP